MRGDICPWPGPATGPPSLLLGYLRPLIEKRCWTWSPTPSAKNFLSYWVTFLPLPVPKSSLVAVQVKATDWPLSIGVRSPRLPGLLGLRSDIGWLRGSGRGSVHVVYSPALGAGGPVVFCDLRHLGSMLVVAVGASETQNCLEKVHPIMPLPAPWGEWS